jgi:hypothetical protein
MIMIVLHLHIRMLEDSRIFRVRKRYHLKVSKVYDITNAQSSFRERSPHREIPIVQHKRSA